MDQITNRLTSLIFSTGQLIREKVKQGTTKNLSFVHIETLRFIHCQKKCTMKDLSGYLHITSPSITALTDNLVKNRIIKRVEDKKDGRITWLCLTKKGNKLMERKFKKVSSIMKSIISTLNETEKHNFIKILNKISKV